MSSEPCTGVQERLIEALLAQRDAAAPDLGHTEGCDACRAHRDDLLAMRAGLDAAPEPELRPELAERTLRRAREALQREIEPSRAPLPEGFGRQLVRVLSAPLLLLPVIVAWNAAVVFYGGELLAGFVPAALLGAIGAAYAVAAGSTLALLFGSIPFVAQHEALRRLREVTP